MALWERARSPDAEQADVDALLVAMDRPVWPGENVRPRADVLRLILDDVVAGGLRGGDGRRLDETAVQSLVALGEPYASGLSAEGRKLLQNAPPPRRARDEEEAEEDEADGDETVPPRMGGRLMWRHIAGPLILAWSLFEVYLESSVGISGSLSALVGLAGLLVTIGTVLIPGLLLTLHPGSTRRTGYLVCSCLTLLSIPGMLLLGMASLFLGGKNAFDASISQLSFFTVMKMGAGVRAFLLLCLFIEWKTSRPSTPVPALPSPPPSGRDGLRP